MGKNTCMLLILHRPKLAWRPAFAYMRHPILVMLIGLFFLMQYGVAPAADFASNLKEITIADSAGTNKPPVAIFTYTQNSEIFSFDASGSTDTDGNITKYTWDFGNGRTSAGKTASYIYTDTASFQVTLTIVDNNNGVSIHRKIVDLLPSCTAEYGPAPVAPTQIDDFGDFMILTKITLACKGTLAHIYANLRAANSTNRTFKYVVYSDYSNSPDRLIYVSNSTMSSGENIYSSYNLAIEMKPGQYWIGIAENPADSYWPRLYYSAGSSVSKKVRLTQQEYDNLSIDRLFSSFLNTVSSGSDRDYGLKVSF